MKFRFNNSLYRIRSQRINGFLRSGLLCVMLLISYPAMAANPFGAMFGMMGGMANLMSLMMGGGNSLSGLSAMPLGAFSGLPMNGLGSLPMSGFSGLPMSGLSSLPMTGFSGLPMSGLPGMPGNGFSSNPFSLPGNNGYGNYGAAPQPTNSPGNFWLNGLWATQTGMLLHINNKTFQLRTQKGTLMGYATSNGELLNLYVPKSNQTLLFVVNLAGGYLQLRDQRGNTLLFQKRGV